MALEIRSTVYSKMYYDRTILFFIETGKYGKCSKISKTLKLQTPKIIAENNFSKHPKKSSFFGKVNF